MSDYNPIWWLVVLFGGALIALIPIISRTYDELKAVRSLLERLPARGTEDLQTIRAELTNIHSAMRRWEEAEHQRQGTESPRSQDFAQRDY